MRHFVWFTALTLLVAPALAIDVDGVKDADYGDPLAVQLVGTQFGNNDNDSVDEANGSELDAAYGILEDGVLYLLFTGNLQTNFNKFEVFIDALPGGQNQLRGDNPDVDFNGLNRMGFASDEQPGLIFDADIEVDYFVTYTNGIGGSGSPEHYLNAAQILTDGGGLGAYVGGGVKADVNPISATGPVGGNISATIDNSNILGVGPLGQPFDSDPETVTTGFELAIDTAEFGWDGTSPIRVVAFVNGGGHDFVSNQVAGPLPADTENLGEPRLVDFSAIDGAQWFEVPTGVDPCAGQVLGDANCDGIVNNFDIDAFVLALTEGEDAWNAAYGSLGCDYLCVADIDGNGLVNNFDIDPFVALLTGK